MLLVGLCICVLYTNVLARDSVETLEDGVLITRVADLKIQSAEWTILVTIDPPAVDSELAKQVVNLIIQVSNEQSTKNIPGVLLRAWFARLRSLKVYLQDHRYESFSAHSSRSKRGLLDFVGAIGHTLFGLATDGSVLECRQAVARSRKEQKMIVHQVNQLTTVVNRTQENTFRNRIRINELTTFLSNALVPRMNEMIMQLNHTTKRVLLLERAFYFEKAVSLLEHVVGSFREAVQKYWRQKASLELGRLTEDVLTLPQLERILLKATSAATLPIRPIQWYYEHSFIYPVWGGDTLIYRVKVPLVNARTYNRYQLATWPVPYVSKGYSIQVNLDQSDVGVDTVNGDLFKPSACIGWKPMVCRSGPTYTIQRRSCARTLITGNRAHSGNCQVTIRKGFNQTAITEISAGEYVVVTNGETIEKRCQGSAGERQRINAGTYVVAVPENCQFSGSDWALSGLIQRVGHVSVKALRVTAPVMLNITQIIPVDRAIEILDQPQFDQMAPVAKVNLVKLSSPNYAFAWEQHGSRLSFGLLIFLAVLVTILVITVIILWKRRMAIYSWLKIHLQPYVSEQKVEPNLDSVHDHDDTQTSVFTFSGK